jgi:hypothetical protein
MRPRTSAVMCRECGGGVRTFGDICHQCRTEPVNHGMPEGRWVGGLVKRFVKTPIPRMPAHTLGHTCDCGCLLVNDDEDCPQCIWVAIVNYERKAA